MMREDRPIEKEIVSFFSGLDAPPHSLDPSLKVWIGVPFLTGITKL